MVEQAEAKGIGNSTTLSQDAADRETAHRVLLSLSESVAGRLRRSGQSASMVSTEIKYNTFKKVSHQTTLLTPTSQTDIIYQTACCLFDEIWDGTPVRRSRYGADAVVRGSLLSGRSAPAQKAKKEQPKGNG